MRKLRCLITAGPTREHLDPIRFLSNSSSGKMGYALATEAITRGWDVDLVSGPVALERPAGSTLHSVVSADEMYAACRSLFDACDLFIGVAAVADFRPRHRSTSKLKKGSGAVPTLLELEPTIDVLKTLSARKRPGQLCVGFAAETNDLEAYARRKLEEKNLDWIVANDVSRTDIGMNSDLNEVVLLSRSHTRFVFGPAEKSAVAAFILDTIVPHGLQAEVSV